MLIDNSLCSTGCAIGQTEVHFTWTKATQVEVLTHETGHLLHFRAWDGQNQTPNYSRNGDSGWHPHEYEWEEAAFYEGFATYVAAAAVYDTENSSVTPMIGGRNAESNNYSSPIPCATAGGYPETVTRAFWDLDDAANEAAHPSLQYSYADITNMDSADILEVLEDFSSGSGNRQRQESDLNGPNMLDFLYNGYPSYLNFWAFLGSIYHNCLESQDFD